jgi:hypothetical protein
VSQQLLITITAKDGASQTFRTVGTSAQSMGNSIRTAATNAGGSLQKVSADSSKAAQSFDKLEAEAKGAAQGMSSLEDRATKIGAALGTTVAALSRFGASAENQRRQVDGIRKAYGSAADQILDFTESIQQSTKFSNEEARQAAQIAATLAQNYGFTADEVEKLIEVSADLASVHGIGLADAVQRTTAAMRGEAESAEALGLTLNQQAIDRNNATLSMSNAEAAHFRMNALLEQAAFAEGTAGEAAATAAGQAAQLGNAMQDIGVKIGAALGPVGGMTAGLADIALILPVVGAGAGKALAGMQKLAQAAKGSQAAMGALSFATGPVGIALGAAAAAAGLVINAWADNEAANAELASSYDALAAAIAETMTATQQLAAQDIRFDFGIQDQIDALGGSAFEQALGTDFAEYQKMLDRVTLDTREQAQANQMLAESYRAVDSDGLAPLISAMNRLETETESFKVAGDDTLAMLTDLTTVLQYNGDGAEFLDGVLSDLNLAYSEGRITAQQYAEALDYIANNTAGYIAANRKATEATKELTQAQQDAARFAVEEGLRGQSERYEALARSIEKANQAALAPSLASGRGFGLMTEAEREQFESDLADYKAGQEEAAQLAIETANALRDQLVPALDGASSGFASLAQPGEDTLDVLDRIAPTVKNVGGSLLQLSDGLNDAAQGMDAVLSTFSALDALGQRSGQAQSIASNLVGDVGEWATIDDLLANAAISVGEYNAAVQAGYGIQAKDAEIQEELNAIRAQQLPLLDQQMAQYRAYIDRLGEASTAEQQQALYLMESGNQAKVAASYSTAYAASLGEIPEDIATEIIANGAQADPVLGDILEKFGLIEVGADGEVRVNFPDAATLDDVTAAIDNLTETQIEIAVATSGADEAQAVLDATSDNLDDIDGRQANATVTAQDNATPALQDANAEVEELDGKVATAVVEVKTEFSTQAAKSPLTGANAPQDETVTISIVAEDNASVTLDKVSAAVSSLDAKAGSIDITATDNASSVISRVMQAASALQTVAGEVELNATDKASSVIARVMQAASALSSVAGDVKLDATDNASSVIARAMQAGNSFDSQTYTASLNATDNATPTIQSVVNEAKEVALDYYAVLNATDNASQPIAQATLVAYDFATTYTATLGATDNATSIIQGVVNEAREVALDYYAGLYATDNASSVISSVSGQLAALDGTVATVYVDAVQRGQLPARLLGGAILPDIPHAAQGRVVQVGEAGPEAVVLPFGSMVQPSPASEARIGQESQRKQSQKSLMPDVDLKTAYRKGGESAKAFYDGLLDEAKSRIQELRSELSSTVYGSEEEAKAALNQYARFVNERDRLKNKRGQAAEFDREQRQATRAAEKAAADVEATMSDAGADVAAAGSEAGEAFSSELASGIDLAATMEQIRALKDEFIQSMRSAGGAVGGVESAVASFNSEIDSITSGLKGASKATDNQTDKMSDDFGALEESASESGEAAGEELSTGIGDGAKDAGNALDSVSASMDDIASTEIAPEIGADNKDALAGLKQTGSELDDLDGKDATVNVKVDDSAWEQFKDDVDAAQLGVVVTVKTKEKGSEKKQGGAILSEQVPAAALGRVVMVGEAGPEAVVLPYGSMVIPHPASGARAAQEARGQGLNFYAPVTFILPNGDIAGAVMAQMTGVDR